MKHFAMALATALVCGPAVIDAQEPPALKDDLKALLGGEWRRPADKGPDWVRLRLKNPKKGEFLFEVWVYPDREAVKKPVQGFASGALLQEDKTKRFIYYGDDKNKLLYRLKGDKLTIEGKFTAGSPPRKVIVLSGDWVRVPPPKKEEKE
jgi:hypothetical protein